MTEQTLRTWTLSTRNDEQVNGNNRNVDETPQNMETDVEVDEIALKALPNQIWQRICRNVF